MSRRLALAPANQFAAKTVDWLWQPYIPRGFVTILAGPKWAGKTWAALGMVTGLSTGNLLPNQAGCHKPVSVGMISSEDPIEYVLRPRLESLGADLTRVHLAYGAVGLTDLTIDDIDKQIEQYDLSLFIVDPLLSFIPLGHKSISAESMRGILDPLGEIANKRHMAILVVTHLSKQPYAEALDRISGSSQITAMARSILFADRDPDNPDDLSARILVHAGTNLARPGPSWRYFIGEDGTFSWDMDASATGVDRLFGLGREDLSEDLTGAAQSAFAVLTEECPTWTPALHVIGVGEAHGISRRTMQRTAARFCIRRRAGVGTAQQVMYWKLRVFAESNDGA